MEWILRIFFLNFVVRKIIRNYLKLNTMLKILIIRIELII